MIRIRFVLVAARVGLVTCGLWPLAPGLAQGFRWPENPKNIKVLPDSIRGARLGVVMRGFTGSLGVRCEHCHVGSGNDLTTFDFASDEKETKRIARVMIEMVQQINGTSLEKLTALGRPAAQRIEVTCTTCHRGQPRPLMIEDVFLATLDSAGMDSAIVQYKALRKEFYGGFVYDFRPVALGTLAERLSGQKRYDDAVRVLQLSLEYDPDFYSTHFTLATVQERAGRKPEALASMERALELAPEQFKGFLQQQVERLRRP
jgi:hypothetical protein